MSFIEKFEHWSTSHKILSEISRVSIFLICLGLWSGLNFTFLYSILSIGNLFFYIDAWQLASQYYGVLTIITTSIIIINFLIIGGPVFR